jgi:hypothetical protein
LAAGDVAAAMRDVTEASEPATSAGFHGPGQPGWCLGTVLTAAGNAERAVSVMLEAVGGRALADVLPVYRPRAAADLVEGLIALDDLAGSRVELARAEATHLRR